MLGFRYIKVPPTTHLIQYSGGSVKREGPGLSGFFFSPFATLVAVPVGTCDAPFIFEELSSDFQELTVQGQVTYQISNPKQIATQLDFSLDKNGTNYASDDPQKLPQRVINIVKILTSKHLMALPLREAITARESVTQSVGQSLLSHPELSTLGVAVLGLSILAIKANPETSSALEAETKEALLAKADNAIFQRRNAAVDHERTIRENELRSEITVEEKKKELVDLSAANSRKEADAKAYSIDALLKAISGIDPSLLSAIAHTGMSPDQLIAEAFGDIAAKADKIGQLNISPDLLQNLLGNRKK